MSQRTLEQRLTDLEQQVAELRTAQANGERPKDWRRTIGMFTGDDVMMQIFDEAMKYRERDRERARRRNAKKRVKK